LKIVETVYKGNIRPWGKTKKSLTVIHIPRSLADDLQHWKEKCPNSAPEAPIFANQAGGFLDTDNYRKRVLRKLAKDLKLPKLAGHTEDHRNVGAKERHSEGRAGSAPALPDSDNHRRLHAGDSRERASNGQLNQSGIEEVGR
jgi:hypothetical protein